MLLMSDMMAIVSKAVFDKDARGARLGQVLPMKLYKSASKHLEKLDGNSRLFLVTVRPPKEALWLVAVLEGLKFTGKQWNATSNRYPLSDITALIGQLQFDSGKGIQAKTGALGMSLQTPRVLTTGDVALLLAAAGGAKPPPVAKPPKPPRPPGPVNVAAHADGTPLPCLCVKCLPAVPESLAVESVAYFRAKVEARNRLLWFWVPAELKEELSLIESSVKARLHGRLKPFSEKPPAGAAKKDADGDEDEDDED